MPIPPIPPNGSLIVGTTTPQVYLIENQQRRWIPDPGTFQAMGFRWEDIQQFTDAEVNLVPLGPPLPPMNKVQVHVSTDLSAGHFMTTDAALLPTGALTAFTRTQTVTWFGGFTGGVQVVMVNANDVVIGISGEHTFGVDGTWIGVSDRTESWAENIDPAVAGQTTRLGVIHGWAPKVDVSEMLRTAIEVGRTIWELIGIINEEDNAGAGTS